MRNRFLYIFLLIFSVVNNTIAQDRDSTFQKWRFNVRAGYCVGGTVPLGFPSEMRGLNSYSPKFNFRVGGEVERMINSRFGVLSGLYVERKGFRSDVRLRQYNVIMERGGERITGPFTGNVIINIMQTAITIPFQATWWINDHAKLKCGPYISAIVGRSFYGNAYGNKVYDSEGNWTGEFDAYLRRGEVRGEKIVVGNVYTDENGTEVDKRGSFGGDEFDNYMRRFQWGIDLGFDYYFCRHWGAFADLSYGFNSAFTSDSANPVRMGLHPLYFTLGVVYKFK